MAKIRLTAEEIQAIRCVVLERDPKAKIILFGSRAQVDQRGGDIDLLILSDLLSYEDILPIKRDLFERLEEQKIDIIIAKDDTEPFVKIALKTGVLL